MILPPCSARRLPCTSRQRMQAPLTMLVVGGNVCHAARRVASFSPPNMPGEAYIQLQKIFVSTFQSVDPVRARCHLHHVPHPPPEPRSSISRLISSTTFSTSAPISGRYFRSCFRSVHCMSTRTPANLNGASSSSTLLDGGVERYASTKRRTGWPLCTFGARARKNRNSHCMSTPRPSSLADRKRGQVIA